MNTVYNNSSLHNPNSQKSKLGRNNSSQVSLSTSVMSSELPNHIKSKKHDLYQNYDYDYSYQSNHANNTNYEGYDDFEIDSSFDESDSEQQIAQPPITEEPNQAPLNNISNLGYDYINI